MFTVPQITSIPALEPAIAKLAASLTALTTSHAENASMLISLADEERALQAKEQNLRKLVEEAENKRSWFSEFRLWMDSLADLLDSKVISLAMFHQLRPYVFSLVP